MFRPFEHRSFQTMLAPSFSRRWDLPTRDAYRGLKPQGWQPNCQLHLPSFSRPNLTQRLPCWNIKLSVLEELEDYYFAFDNWRYLEAEWVNICFHAFVPMVMSFRVIIRQTQFMAGYDVGGNCTVEPANSFKNNHLINRLPGGFACTLIICNQASMNSCSIILNLFACIALNRKLLRGYEALRADLTTFRPMRVFRNLTQS